MRNLITYITCAFSQWGKRFIHLPLALLFSTSLILSSVNISVFAAPPPQANNQSSIELTIRYNSDLQTMEVLNQRILDFPAPKNRSNKLEGGQFLFQFEDGLGVALGNVPVNDPTELRSEWVDEGSNKSGLLTGQKVTVPETVFQVVIPLNENLNRIKLLKPRPTQKGNIKIQKNALGEKNLLQSNAIAEPFEVLGSSNVDNAAIQAFINSKKQQ